MPDYIDYRSERKVHVSGTLPHWNVDDGVYFVTWRLADSLPADDRVRIARAYRREMDALDAIPDVEQREAVRSAVRQEFFVSVFDASLDSGGGRMWLTKPEFARVVEDALLYFDGRRYLIIAWAIMGNHVHVIFRRHPNFALEKVLHSWKSFTAHELKPRTDIGPGCRFWQRNYWDRLIRSHEELDSTIRYVLENPTKAGLTKGAWVGYHPEALKTQWPPDADAE